ncbi:MAG: hypothetical protein II320_03435 [Oscillospiraceae bacterium]|nr:hypothetical protein [Oscillospiraceae bacterium]
MKTASRLLSALLVLCLLLSMFGCGMDPASETNAPVTEVTDLPAVDATEDLATTPITETAPPTSSPETEPPAKPTEPPAEPTEAPTVHSHKFSAATCTDPQICATCGETKGQPTGHIWQDPTCLSPATCSSCGKTKGSSADHAYRNGSCSFCGKDQPASDNGTDQMVWIPTNGGKKYHSRSDCSKMKDPERVTVSEAEALGFTACKKCW